MSGALALLAAGGMRVSLSNQTVSEERAATAACAYQLENDGDVVALRTASNIDVGDWIRPRSAAGSAYECRATIVSGALSSGVAGTWQSLGTTRSWAVAQSGTGTASCVFDVEIRHVASGVVKATARITLSANVI